MICNIKERRPRNPGGAQGKKKFKKKTPWGFKNPPAGGRQRGGAGI